MIKVYGMPTCPDCAYVHVQIKDRTGEFEYINIGEDVQYLKEFVRLRDKEAAFDECRENGYLGIPCFVREDGNRYEKAGNKIRTNGIDDSKSSDSRW